MKCIVFDFDGTVANPFESVIDSLNHVSKKYPFEIAVHHSLLMKTVSQPFTQTLIQLWPKASQSSSEDIKKYYLEHQLAVGYLKYTIYEGLTYLLQDAELNQADLVVLSNKMEVSLKKVISHLNLKNFMQIIGKTDEQLKKAYWLNQLKLKYGNHNVVMVGDSKEDQQSCTETNTPFIAVNWGVDRFDKSFAAENAAELLQKIKVFLRND